MIYKNHQKIKKMKKLNNFHKFFNYGFHVKSSIKKESTIINSENINRIGDLKEKNEIKFSCGEDSISEYLDDGWVILKEDSQEKICTELFLLLKIVIWKRIKDVKLRNLTKLV